MIEKSDSLVLESFWVSFERILSKKIKEFKKEFQIINPCKDNEPFAWTKWVTVLSKTPRAKKIKLFFKKKKN